MKTFAETNLPFLEEDCRKRFGEEDGTQIMRCTVEIYDKLTAEADYKNNQVIEEHLRKKLFPAMAYYKALRASGLSAQDALPAVQAETQKAAEKNRERYAKMLRLPATYFLYRLGAKKYMKKAFPPEGWQTEWVRCDSKEIHFNLRRCIYWELCQEHDCPELCAVYCANDITAFSGLLPKIKFERQGTLSEGAACCDFHLVKAV